MTHIQSGARGGRSTLARHGRDHMAAIGRKGYLATLSRYWQGDRAAYHAWLAGRNWDVVADRLAGREIARKLDDGETIHCVEMPSMSYDVDIPW